MALSTEDRLAILDIYARRAEYFDSGQAEDWAALFTSDGRLTVRGGVGVQGREVQGQAELASFARAYHDELYLKRGIRHMVSNLIIEPTETGAVTRAYVMVLRVGDGQPAVIEHTGRYADELVKTERGWRFKSRTFNADA